MFRKTYVSAKKEIDDWLRQPSYINPKLIQNKAMTTEYEFDFDDHEDNQQLLEQKLSKINKAN